MYVQICKCLFPPTNIFLKQGKALQIQSLEITWSVNKYLLLMWYFKIHFQVQHDQKVLRYFFNSQLKRVLQINFTKNKEIYIW